MYENRGAGIQKMSHERMLNDQGRKIIKQKIGNDYGSYDHFKNVSAGEGAHKFDDEWNRVANNLGFQSKFNNALEYSNNDPFGGNG